MNRNRYRLVFSTTLGMFVPQAETARGRGKAPGSVSLAGVVLASVALAPFAYAQLPVPAQVFVASGQASYQTNGTQGIVSQVGNVSILDWRSFNVGAGNTVQFRQVDALGSNNLVAGAKFTSLNRIWDINPSVIGGGITQGAGQQANVYLVNNSGIVFTGGAQINVNSFTATSLNIADKYITGGLLGDNSTPQFEGAQGFVKVLEGASITAGNQGRVMLIAPTVVNKGSISAPDGQVILAAGTKAYLRSADNADMNVRGLLVEVDSQAGLNDYVTANTSVPAAFASAADDKLGHATNEGTVTAARGNVTMVGYAVNQKGIARATTSAVSNGSIYLMAKDTAVAANNSKDSSRGGRVILGAGSTTEVLVDTTDTLATVDGTGGKSLDKKSEVLVLGQQIYMDQGAKIVAPAAKVDFVAVDDPSLRGTTFGTAAQSASANARIHIANGATISVAGLENVAVSAARNSVEVELRGDELKDSSVNQVGPLRGQKGYIDVERALANAEAGKSTLIAKDSLLAYQAKTTRTVAERSTTGGSVSLRSQGETIVEAGVSVDLSGGSLQYTAALLNQTAVSANGKLTYLTDALATVRYDGIPTQLKVDYGRWNKTDVFGAGPTSTYYDPGYTEGKSAGALSISSMGAAVLQANIQGRTTVGERQRASGNVPQGATLRIGTNDVVAGGLRDYKFNQDVLVRAGASAVAQNLGVNAVLTAAQRQTLEIDAGLLARNRVANLEVYSNKAVATVAALNAPQKGQVTLVGHQLTVGADIATPGGTVNLAALNNAVGAPSDSLLQVADGVSISAKGTWVNNRANVGVGDAGMPVLDGGSVSLTADGQATSTGYDSRGTVRLGAGVKLDASGGARMDVAGKVTAGKGGSVAIKGFAVEGLANSASAFAVEKGGSFALTANRIKIGGATESGFGTVNLGAEFFTRGGFGDYKITGLDSLEVAAGTVVQPTQVNRELLATASVSPSQSGMENVSREMVRDARTRTATHISLAAKQSDVGAGSLLVGEGASIAVETGGRIALEARNTLDVRGALIARGGTVDLLLDRSSGFVASAVNENLLWLANTARIDVSGVAQTYRNSAGLTQGVVTGGGAVNLTAKTGYVVAQAGSQINVAGAASVTLDVPNETGGVGRSVGSDGGAVNVFAEEGVILEASLQAQGGSASNRGGDLKVALSKNARAPSQIGFDTQARELRVSASASPQTAGLSATTPIPMVGTQRANLGWDRVEGKGFDTVTLSSRDGIVLENGLDIGAGSATVLRDLTLDAARIDTTGGNVNLRANSLRMGNYDTANRVGADPAAASAGTLMANARRLELAGNLRLRGAAQNTLTGTEIVQLSGVTRDQLNASGGSDGKYEHSANISSEGNLTLASPVVVPGTYSDVTLSAAGKTVRIEGMGATPQQPLSALGKLKIQAQDIEQAGRIWAPLGNIVLEATRNVTLASGSVTSVAAEAGSIVPLGQIQNGKDWVVNVRPAEVPGGQLVVKGMPGKEVRISGNAVDMQVGSSIDIRGGGDIQAYEFTVGPGGSRDILADPNMFAVVPSYKGGFAPSDPQEAFGRKSGESVYLSGVPGLPNGTYTLLPAHYALLPGAYAVRLDTKSAILPGQEFTRQDGVRIASGYLTDSRAGAPRDASWKGFEVLTRDQVKARSELATTQASSFFASGSSRPQDAGLLSIATTGTGAASLALNGSFATAAATGGRGAAIDFSAQKIAVVSGAPTGLDPLATVLHVETLNSMGARSLLIGGTRSVDGTTTTLVAGADEVTLANDSTHALRAPEVILMGKDTVNLKAGSDMQAQGTDGDAGIYTTAGNGALVRAAATTAQFVRTGSPNGTQGTLRGEAGSTVTASSSILLDATKNTDFKGTARFNNGLQDVAGNLAVGAVRVNFGNAPAGTSGISYSQAALDAMNALASMTFTSYSTFDLHGNVQVGGLDSNGKPTMRQLTLQGAGLAGLGAAGDVAQINAKQVTFQNPGGVAFAPGAALGAGQLSVNADKVVLGAGDKTLSGFSDVRIVATEVMGQDKGKTESTAPLTLTTARLSGAAAADQTLSVNGALTLNAATANPALATVTALGASWSLSGDSVHVDSPIVLPGGVVKIDATSGNVTLGSGAHIDVAGRSVNFFDVQQAASAGGVVLTSATGNVDVGAGSVVDVSGAAGGNAGTVAISAVNGTVTVAAGSLKGTRAADAKGKLGDGARALIDVQTLASFSALNTALSGVNASTANFDGQRHVRVRSGDVAIAVGDTVRAESISVSADAGKLTVSGKLDASAPSQGAIALYASGDTTVAAGAQLVARSTEVQRRGGTVEVGSTSGTVTLATGSSIDVSAGAGGEAGRVKVRALRTANDVNVAAVSSTVTGASAVEIEALKRYTAATLNAATLTTVAADNASFAGAGNVNITAMKNRLIAAGASTPIRILASAEITSAGDMTLGADWNLSALRAGGEPGVLTLRSSGNLTLNGSVSDGFADATRYNNGNTYTSASTPSLLRSDASWAYRMVAGADATAANPLATTNAAKDFTLATDKMVRTGTGDIQIAASRDIKLSSVTSVVYTAGRAADVVSSAFVAPNERLRAYFSQGGGDVNLAAGRDVIGATPTNLTAQMYSEWLFRQGRLTSDGQAYYDSWSANGLVRSATPPSNQGSGSTAWWVRFDRFNQGIGALGGGNVKVVATGKISNLSASTPTQGRMASADPGNPNLVRTGGGNVRIEMGVDLLGGQYFADAGNVTLNVGGKIGSGWSNGGKPVYTQIALGEGVANIQARSDVNLHAIVNPTLLPQSFQSTGTANSTQFANTNGSQDPVLGANPHRTLFSTMAGTSAVAVTSLNGNVVLHSAGGATDAADLKQAYQTTWNTTEAALDGYSAMLSYVPASLAMVAMQGNVDVRSAVTMAPSAKGQLLLLAKTDVNLAKSVAMSDREISSIPNPVRPANLPTAMTKPDSNVVHARTPVHLGDAENARVYAVDGSVTGTSQVDGNASVLDMAKALSVKAGTDIRNVSARIQHADVTSVSVFEAGRGVSYASGAIRSEEDGIRIGGAGRLEVTAGRNINLGTSSGIRSVGDLDNANLSGRGADVQLTAGAGKNGVDYVDVVTRLLAKLESGAQDTATLWQARWLVGNDALSVSGALAAVRQVAALGAQDQRTKVRDMVFTALRTTGRDSNTAASGFGGDFSRGYSVLNLVFPGIEEKTVDGSFAHYQGDIDLFASRVKTERGGNIELMAPGGKVVVGLANTPNALVGKGGYLLDDALGLVVTSAGDIKGFARDDMVVNQSRILTVGGGNVLLWSSEGGIDAGKGAKTASAVPPPVIKVDSQGNVAQELQGAATGSGIGALSTAGGKAGDVDLIAPKGTVDAGDAGIRAGNLNVAAFNFKGADNVAVSGASMGTPVADTSAVTAATSGATSQGDDATKSVVAASQAASESARTAQALASAFKPSLVRVEVLGYGE